jgi:hypothetical protein
MCGVKCFGGCGVAFGSVASEGVVAPKTTAPIYACVRCFSGADASESCNVALCKNCMNELIKKQPNERSSRKHK